MKSIISTIAMTAAAVATDHCQLLPEILTIAQTAMIGALMTTCNPMEMSICTCVTSLDVRVIRLAVENLLISSMEKLSTFSKSCPLSL